MKAIRARISTSEGGSASERHVNKTLEEGLSRGVANFRREGAADNKPGRGAVVGEISQSRCPNTCYWRWK